MRLALLIAALLLAACPSKLGSGPTPLQKRVGQKTSAPRSHPRNSGGASTPGAGGCPSSAPVECGTSCCPSGDTCAAGVCTSAAAGSCPASSPVACTAPVHCADGACVARDSSGHGNDAAIARGTLTPARFGSGLDAGSACAAQATMATRGFPAGNAPFTLEAWMKGASEWVLYYGSTGDPAASPVQLVIGNPGLNLVGPAGQCSLAVPGATSATWATFHHYAATWDGARATLYFDGSALGACSLAPFAAGAGSVFSVALAGSAAACPSWQLDELRVLTAAQTPDQIAADAAAPLAVTAATAGLWHFDEGAAFRCCGAGQSCRSDGSCGAAGVPAPACPSAAPVACGNQLCCPSGSACTGAGCVTVSCPADTPQLCGATCCPAASSCAGDACAAPTSAGLCDAAHPTACGDGTCCSASQRCAAGQTCVENGPLVQRSGPQGPSCGAGRYCDTGQICTPGASCCPPDSPTSCGSLCCPSGAVGCEAGGCGCARDELACGANCCKLDESCVDGFCFAPCADSKAPIPCGDVCCATSTTCAEPALGGGNCACPPETPTECGDLCCGPHANCTANGCACAPGHDACGAECCGDGQSCSNGRCVEGQVQCLPGEQRLSCGGSAHCCNAAWVCCNCGFTSSIGVTCCPKAFCL